MAWTNLVSDQRSFVRDLEANLTALQRFVSPATIYSTTAPTDAQIAAQWAVYHPPAYQPNNYEVMQWVDPSTNTLKNHYRKVEDIASTSSTTVQRPVVEFPSSPISWTAIQEIYIGEAGGAATQTFSGIPQIYRDLYLYVQLRDSANAAAANISIRINGSASALYGYSFQAANTSVSLGGEQVGATGFLLPSPAASVTLGQRSNYHNGLFQVWDYALTTRNTRVYHRGAYMQGLFAATTYNNVHGFGLYNSPAAVTSLTVVSATGYAPGTRLVLFGV